MDRIHDGKSYRVILGKLRGKCGHSDPMVEQTYRYSREAWTAGGAASHCQAHDGQLFERATE
jgi:hypothetical protein